jgi:hypothetical protein
MLFMRSVALATTFSFDSSIMVSVYVSATGLMMKLKIRSRAWK